MKTNGYHPENGHARLEMLVPTPALPGAWPAQIEDGAGLEELLSRPTRGVLETFAKLDGDVMILGVGGKMGPTLARMARRAFEQLGKTHQVIGVARFGSKVVRHELEENGVKTTKCDLLDRQALARLPDAPNIVFMAGQKFGTASGPELTWAMNTLVPSYVAERFPRSRIVAFSTGCVYPLVPISGGGSREEDALGPPGDYANSCVGRERIFSHFSRQNHTPVALIRLNYAIDLRYGVLLDVAQKVWAREPMDVTMGHANVIWQGDANAQALQAFDLADSPPFVLNLTGPETVSIRALALRFGEIMDREVTITGIEAETAWLNNAGRLQGLFGYPQVSLQQMIAWTAHWIEMGGQTHGKPMHFEARDGQF